MSLGGERKGRHGTSDAGVRDKVKTMSSVYFRER